MAGDWLKWQKGFSRKPEVVDMAAILSRTRQDVATRLMELWEWADDNVTEERCDSDGNAFVTLRAQPSFFIDDLAGVSGFADAMTAVGWLRTRNGSLEFPNFSRHNGKPAKDRALGKKRSKRHRNENVTQDALPEKRREEKSKEPPNPPGGDEWFEKFWSVFPSGRKHGKGEARKAWKVAVKKVSPETIVAAAEEYAKSPVGRGQYVKGPAPWLNQECWADDRIAWQRGEVKPAETVFKTASEKIAETESRNRSKGYE